MSESQYRVRLLRWSESSSGGRTVTFQLPDDGDEHPFKGLETGKREGALLELGVRPADDPEAPLETLAPEVRPEPVRAAAAPRPRVRRGEPAAAPVADDGSESGTGAGGRHGAAAAASQREPSSAWRSMFSYPPGEAAPGDTAAASDVGLATAVPPGDVAATDADPGLALNAMAQAALDMRRAAIEIAQDRGDGGGGEADGETGGVVERATTLCKEIDHQRAGFFYYMKTRYPAVPDLPPEIGQWSRDAHATRNRVCFHCETAALAELGLDAKAERRFEGLEADYERTERNR